MLADLMEAKARRDLIRDLLVKALREGRTGEVDTLLRADAELTAELDRQMTRFQRENAP